MGKLEGKVALVTGAGRGIGRSAALKLAGEGARLVVNDLDDGPAAAVVGEIAATGGEAVACPGDITAKDFAERFIGTALERFGGLDIIVNNAGFIWPGPIQKMTDEQWEAVLACHLTAPFRILRAAQPVLRELRDRESEEGREHFRKVVNVSSVAGLGGSAGHVNYAAAKAGIIGVTKTLAKEWGELKVNVNCVAFGLIRTRLTEIDSTGNHGIDIDGRRVRVGLKPELMEAYRKEIPLGREGTAEEAAGAIYLFCLPESDYITGQTVVCGGGLSI